MLFERFSRSPAAEEIAGGSGLGLAIPRSYALAHNGDLRYEPVSPQGARVELVLPADRDDGTPGLRRPLQSADAVALLASADDRPPPRPRTTSRSSTMRSRSITSSRPSGEAVASGALSGRTLAFAKVVKRHENAHVAALKKALGSSAIAADVRLQGTIEDQTKFQKTSMALENLGVAAYKG